MTALQVLVVEDDSLIAMLLMDTLLEMGHGVCGVEATEAGAIASALGCRPDLIIIDAQLRDGNGVSATLANWRCCEMNGGYRREDEPEGSAQRSDWRSIHHSSLFWVGILLCLTAISIYVFSDDLSWRNHR
jgi:hypothetical protein